MKELDKSRIWVLINMPFFAELMLQMELIVSREVPTAATNGVYIKVNPDFFLSLSPAERRFLLCHEVMHPAFLHHTRRDQRDPKVWNEACDYAINPMIVEYGELRKKQLKTQGSIPADLKMPTGGLLDPRFKGMSAEKIYDLLLKHYQKKKGGQGSSGFGKSGRNKSDQGGSSSSSDEWKPGDGFKGGFGDVEDFPTLDKKAVQKEELDKTTQLIQATMSAKKAGTLPGDLARLLKERLNPKIHWATELQRILSEKAKDNYSWAVPNRRYMTTGFYLPTLDSETYGEIAMAVDTSGSITQE